ncbi:MAG TPA: orotidine-5'-phosphate decarboxylase [Sporosarcina sp.]|nr:orotidine-5'-phosphate decarboxylase [Sporosarcina sp.]
MKRTPMIALDFPNEGKTLEFLSKFDESLAVKIGMQLYYSEGPSILDKIKEAGHDIFLDLKLHDIPNTVMSSMEVLAKLGVSLTNVHAAGGREMMEAALEGLDKGTAVGMKRPALIAVTQLTSTSEQQVRVEQLINATLEDSVLHYAKLTKQAGLDGVVCSVHEAKAIEEVCGKEFLKVTPGIRMADNDAGDQKRIATPFEAKQAGSTHIVVGRAITGAADPVEAYRKVLAQWEGAAQ